jgi:hypothetical protein
MMPDRDARKGENEARARLVNEGISGADAVIGAPAPSLEILCECASPECTTFVSLRRADYERVRSEATQFIVAPGHEQLDVEIVVEDAGAFRVVRKREGDAADIARATDPRR